MTNSNQNSPLRWDVPCLGNPGLARVAGVTPRSLDNWQRRHLVPQGRKELGDFAAVADIAAALTVALLDHIASRGPAVHLADAAGAARAVREYVLALMPRDAGGNALTSRTAVPVGLALAVAVDDSGAMCVADLRSDAYQPAAAPWDRPHLVLQPAKIVLAVLDRFDARLAALRAGGA
jgi:hypothetical protein